MISYPLLDKARQDKGDIFIMLTNLCFRVNEIPVFKQHWDYRKIPLLS